MIATAAATVHDGPGTAPSSSPPPKFPQLREGDVLPSHLNRHPAYPNIRFKDGSGPGEVVQVEPSLRTCVASFGEYEYGLIAISAAVPAYIGYSGNRKDDVHA